MVDLKVHTVDATNTQDGPRMFNSIPPVAIPAGQTAHDLRITDAELESMKLYGQFEITGGPLDHDGDGEKGGSEPATPPALTGKNKADLLAIAKDEGVEIEEGATNDDIKSAIELHREQNAT